MAPLSTEQTDALLAKFKFMSPAARDRFMKQLVPMGISWTDLAEMTTVNEWSDLLETMDKTVFPQPSRGRVMAWVREHHLRAEGAGGAGGGTAAPVGSRLRRRWHSKCQPQSPK